MMKLLNEFNKWFPQSAVPNESNRKKIEEIFLKNHKKNNTNTCLNIFKIGNKAFKAK